MTSRDETAVEGLGLFVAAPGLAASAVLLGPPAVPAPVPAPASSCKLSVKPIFATASVSADATGGGGLGGLPVSIRLGLWEGIVVTEAIALIFLLGLSAGLGLLEGSASSESLVTGLEE